MGMSSSNHLVPYLKVIVKKQDKSQSYRSCGNPACSNHQKDMSSAFCSKCGSPQVTLTKVVKEDAVDLDHLIVEQQGEKFYIAREITDRKTGTHFVLPNYSNPQGIKFKEEGEIEIGENQRANDLKWLNEEYKNEIAQIKLLVGEENVSIHWGVISYYS